MRLPVSRIPPKHAVPPHVSKPYNPWEPPGTEKGVCAPRARHDATVTKHFESWGYQDSLSQIGSCSHKILNFSETTDRAGYQRYARQHRAHQAAFGASKESVASIEPERAGS
ncbi:hypothetical protein FSOLCH5_015250 [Fusarium solani]